MQHHVLTPAEYFVELAFDRPVDLGVLHRALTGMGFDAIVFDQSVPKVEVGALTMSAPRTSFATKAVTSAPVAMAPRPAPAPIPAPVAPRPAPTLAAPAIRPTGMTSVLDPSRLTYVRPPVPPPAPAARPFTRSMTSTVQAVRPTTALPPPKPRIPGLGSSTFPGGGGGGGGGAAAPGPALAPGEPFAEAAPPEAMPGEGGGGGGGGEGGFVPDASAVPAEEQAQQAPASLDPLDVVKDLWRRWREWGSPFVDGPGQVRVSGSEESTGGLRVRFVAILRRAISLNDAPGMRWLFVKRLAFSAFSELSYRLVPHPLTEGRTYEFRFLSRAKSTPTRETVRAALAEMGFLPMKLVALKRNMRLPGRPGASLTLWYGIGQWNRADSVIIADDPFAFENVAEVPPV